MALHPINHSPTKAINTTVKLTNIWVSCLFHALSCITSSFKHFNSLRNWSSNSFPRRHVSLSNQRKKGIARPPNQKKKKNTISVIHSTPKKTTLLDYTYIHIDPGTEGGGLAGAMLPSTHFQFLKRKLYKVRKKN